DGARLPRAHHLDEAVLLLAVKLLELTLLLPVVQRADEGDDGDGHDDGYALDPLDPGAIVLLDTEGLVEAQREGDHGGDAQEDEDLVLQRDPNELDEALGLDLREAVHAEDALPVCEGLACLVVV